MRKELRNADALEVNRKIFQDYVNHRDRIRRVLSNPTSILDAKEEQQLLICARKSFRQREWVGTANWFGQFFSETNLYFDTLKIKDWPLMRGR